jgi:hypothetical protein
VYNRLPGLILGYHGCDRAVGEAVLAGVSELLPSTNSYDWLGHGVYFWENNPARALHYARFLQANPRKGRPRMKEPMAIGAVIDPGLCLNLLDAQFLGLLPSAYESFRRIQKLANQPMPENRPLRGSKQLLLRHLDCAVIEMLHQGREEDKQPAFDSVRGVFVEGNPIFPGAGIHQFNHIQLCVRDTACIKGYFRLRDIF